MVARAGSRLQVGSQGGEVRDLEFNVDVFNVLNRNNLTDVVGELSSPLFGRANASLQARTVQLSVKFNFRTYRK